MRRLTALFCLLLLLLTLGGRTLLFELRVAEVRADMRRSLSSGVQPGLVDVFTFADTNADQPRWLDGGGEFEWKGKRYDVLARKEAGGHVIVHAISDERETALVAAFRDGDKKDAGRLASFLLLKLSVLTYIVPTAGPATDGMSYTSSCRHEKHQDLHPRPWRSRLLEPPASGCSLS